MPGGATATYFPAGQATQSAAAALPIPVAYVPAAHAVQLPAPMPVTYIPAAHAKHAPAAATDWCVPAEHTVQLLAAVPPRAGRNKPGPHAAHDATAAALA